MSTPEYKRFTITQVSDRTGVPATVLRRWEQRFSQLRPRRDRAGRRFYLEADIEIVLRIKRLLRHEEMTSAGARKRLAQEMRGEGKPATNREAIELIDKIEQEVRELLDMLAHDEKT